MPTNRIETWIAESVLFAGEHADGVRAHHDGRVGEHAGDVVGALREDDHRDRRPLGAQKVHHRLRRRPAALAGEVGQREALHGPVAAGRDLDLVEAKAPHYLLALAPEFLARSAHFLENHDEPRIASILSLQEHRAAALLTLGLPGLRLVHEGQLCGLRIRTPVQLGRRPAEPDQPEIQSLYRGLLRALKRSAVGNGDGQLVGPRPAGADNPTHRNVVVIQWSSETDSFELLVVNLAAQRSQCLVPLADCGRGRGPWRVKDLLGDKAEHLSSADLGLPLDLAPHDSRLLHCAPVP